MRSFYMLPLLALVGPSFGCLGFDQHPEGDLCQDARRDDVGRAIDYPEWRICRRLGAGGQGGAADGSNAEDQEEDE